MSDRCWGEYFLLGLKNRGSKDYDIIYYKLTCLASAHDAVDGLFEFIFFLLISFSSSSSVVILGLRLL